MGGGEVIERNLISRPLASDPRHLTPFGVAWSVYLVRCADGSLYTGVSTDPAARVRAHNAGKGAAYTRARRPVRLVHEEPAATRSTALRREWAIKKLPHAGKEQLVAHTRRRTPAIDGGFARLRPAAFDFFRRLKRNNTREWFKRHQSSYELEVKQPMQALVEEMDVRLARLAPEIVGDPRKSIFRIHRDIRFSKDKSPYKTHAACWFYHRDAGKGVGSEGHGGAGFYFHFAPEQCFVGGGLWMPPRPALNRLRERLTEDRKAFERALRGPLFSRRFGSLDDELMLKRLPRGFAEGHPAERWLRYQSFTASRTLSQREVLSPRLPDTLSRDFKVLVPLVRWLNRALGFSPAAARMS